MRRIRTPEPNPRITHTLKNDFRRCHTHAGVLSRNLRLCDGTLTAVRGRRRHDMRPCVLKGRTTRRERVVARDVELRHARRGVRRDIGRWDRGGACGRGGRGCGGDLRGGGAAVAPASAFRRQSPCEEASRSERVRARSSRGRDVGARPRRRDAHAQALGARAASVAGVSSLRRGGVSPGGTVVIRRRRRTPQGGQDQVQGRPPSRGFRRGPSRTPPRRPAAAPKAAREKTAPAQRPRTRLPQENQARSQETHRVASRTTPPARARENAAAAAENARDDATTTPT